MKKIVSILLVLVTVLSMGTMAFADGTTTLTTTVPDATYTLNIPADQTVEFNTTKHTLTIPKVTDASGFAVGKNISVTVSKTDFVCEGVSTTIPYELCVYSVQNSKTYTSEMKEVIFFGDKNQAVGDAMALFGEVTYEVMGSYLQFEESDWGKALGGDYTATITFTSEIVAG